MSQKHQVVVEAEPVSTDMAVIMKGLMAYNASKANGDTPNYLFIAIRGIDGSIAGGLIGATYLGWLQIQAVWVSDELRGIGYGSELMEAAETEAVRRGCPRVFLETLSFQALPFYEKRGYKVASQIPDFPPGGGCRYALTKEFDTN